MAMYKIPQDVEADDKFLGPLSFKQFIFIGIAAVSSYLSFLSITRGFPFALAFFGPVIIVAGFLGFPWGRDQPTEIWLAARIRFLLKPRKRIWNQSGAKELVTITAPKRVEKHYTDGLSQNEVKSRLGSLATLLDSRGWAVKDVTSNVYASPLLGGGSNDDRLIDMSAMPAPVTDTVTATDILDESSSSTAIHFEEMIKNSEQKHRQEALDKLAAVRDAMAQPHAQVQSPATPAADFWYLQQGAGAPPQQTYAATAPPQPQAQASAAPQQADFWFLGGNAQGAQTTTQPPQQQVLQAQPALATFQTANVVAPGMPTAQSPITTSPPQLQAAPIDEAAILEKIHRQQEQEKNVAQYGHLKTILPIAEQQRLAQAAQQQPQQPVTPPVNPDIIHLASNDDLNVETIARQAQKATDTGSSDGEVVISLR